MIDERMKNTMVAYLASGRLPAAIVALAALGVYMSTLAPSVGFIDSGELAAVGCTFGVAHPTGYPLYTLLALLMSHVPVAAEKIVRLNMLSALLVAAGVFFFARASELLLSGAAGARGRDSEWSVTAGAAGAALVFAFSETAWSQALVAEVYSLHILFISLVLFAFARVHRGQAGESASRWWVAGGFAIGLSFANHMTTVLLVPGLLIYLVMRFGWSRRAGATLAWVAAGGVLGLTLYAVLPLRASQGPMFSWGDVATFDRFVAHVTAKQYRIWIFSSTEVAGRQFDYFFSGLPAEVGYAPLALAAAGLLRMWRLDRRLALVAVVMAATCVLYAINYDIHDIDSYFLLAYAIVALWAGWGIAGLAVLSWKKERGTGVATAGVLCAASLLPLAVNYARVDQSRNYVVEDCMRNVMDSLPSGSVVFTFQWDYWLSASYYYQSVAGYRTDVAVVDKELLRRSWYLKELERRLPWLIRDSRAEVEAFRVEVAKFEGDRPYDPAVIQGRFVGMIRSMIGRAMQTRPVFVTPEIEPEFTAGWQRIPEGLVLRLAADTSFAAPPPPSFRVRPFPRLGKYEEVVAGLYRRAYEMRGAYFEAYGRREEAADARREGASVPLLVKAGNQ